MKQFTNKQFLSTSLVFIFGMIGLSGMAQFGASPWTAPNGTYSVPANVTSITVECWGGGGGGGGAKESGLVMAAGGGGGGGVYSTITVAVTGGQTVIVTNGTGGIAGSASPANGGNGGTSSVTLASTIVCSANGGTGGTKGSDLSNAFGGGGARGTGGTGTLTVGANGTAGNSSGNNTIGGDGGNGGGTAGGTGGSGGSTQPAGSQPGGVGQVPGGGGGGAAANDINNQIARSAAGGAGGAGQVIITYTVPVFSVTGISPASACPGSSVTITGVNIDSATAVTIGGVQVASITSNTSTQIVVVIGSGTTSGVVAVTNRRGTATSTTSFTVTPIPAQPGAITGVDSICANSTNVYSVAAVTGATSYTWVLPTGWTGTSTTNSISAVSDTSSGTITVVASNTCGSSTTQTLHVTNLPAPNVTQSPLGSVCVNAAAFTLSGGSPAGGTYSGNGVSVGNIFTPSVAGAGSFLIRYTYHYGNCSLSTTAIITVTSVCSGISVNYLNDEINVYPNPTNGIINVSIADANNSELTISVMDIEGRTVYHSVNKNVGSGYHKQINLEQLAKGVYYIKFTSGEASAYKKLVIE